MPFKPLGYDPFDTEIRAETENRLARENPPVANTPPRTGSFKPLGGDPFKGLPTSTDYFDALEAAQADQEGQPRQSRDVGLWQHLAGKFVEDFGGTLGSQIKGAGIGLERARLRATDRMEAVAKGELTPTRLGAGGIPVLDLAKSVGGLFLPDEEREKLEQAELSRLDDPRENFVYKTGEAIDDYLKDLITTNPDLSKQFWAGDITGAAGSIAAYIVGGLFTRGVFTRLGASQKAATLTGSSGLGAGAGATEAFERALKKGASFEDAYRAANFGAGIGLSEGVPIANLFDRFDKASGGRFKSGIKNALKQGGEEGFQEAFQQTMQNATESKLVAYNPEQGLWEGMWHGAAVGVTTGGLLGFLAGLFGGRKGRRGATEDQAEDSPESTPGALGAEETGFLPEVEGELDPEIRAEVKENLRENFNLQDEAEADSIIDAAQAKPEPDSLGAFTDEQRQAFIDADRPRDTTPVIDSKGFGAIRQEFGKAANDATFQDETQRTQQTQNFETILERVPEDVIDPRLKRANIRSDLQRMADSLTIGGDAGVLTFDEANANRPADQEIPGEHLPSVNPEWFQQMVQDPQHDVTVAQAKKAVKKALAGENLGVREERVVRNMLETITGERTDPRNIEFAQDQLAAARRLRASLREGVPPPIAEEIPFDEAGVLDVIGEDEINFGQLLPEESYAVDMDGPARSMQEIYEQADALGLSEQVDRINADSTSTDQEKVFEVLNLIEETLSDQKETGRLPRVGREGEEFGGTVLDQGTGAEEIAAGGILQEPEQPPIGETGAGELLETPPPEVVNQPEVTTGPTLDLGAIEPPTVPQEVAAPQETPPQVKGLPQEVKAPAEEPKPAEDNTRAWKPGEKERLVKLIEGFKALGDDQVVADLRKMLAQERPTKRRSSVEHLDKLLDVAQKQARHEKARKEDEAKAEEEAKQKTEVEPETPPVTEEPPEVKTTKPETEPLRLGNKEAWRKVTGKSFHEITLDEYYERRLMGGKLLDDLRDDELKQAAMFHEIEAAAYNRQLEEAAISRRKGFPSTTDLPLIDLPKSKKPNDLFVFLGKVIEQKLGISIDEEVVLSRQHRKIVEQALNQGKRVPQDVLDAYPQLKGELGKQSDEGETSPVQPQAEPLSPDSQSLVEAPGISLAEQLSSIFSSSQEKLSWQDLFRMADVAYGGTQAEGVYSVKQAYDAAELGLNLSLIQIPPQAQDHGKMIKELERRQNKMPTQTKRDKEQLDLQQFSTPHPHSFVAAWVANLNADDVVLEPSAGTGNLVTYAMKAGAKGIIANELSERRGVLLKRLMGNSPGRQVFHENAANINAILPKDIKPTVVLMNPPFSADVNLPGKKKTEVGAKHVEEALKRLEDNGRLVAILGKGMARDKATFKSWWADIEKKYNVRAIIGISGKEYRKFGTSFDNVIAVIDKTGPTRDTVLTGDVEKVEELPPLLEDIRNDRSPQSKRPSTQPTGQAGAGGPGGGSAQRPAIQPATDQTDTGSKTRRPQSSGSSGSAGTTGSAGLRGGSQSEVQPGAVDRPSDRQGEGRVGVAESGGVGSGTPADSGANSDGKLADQKLGGALGEIEAAEVERKTELQDTTFENYRTPIKIKGAKKHDTPLAESTAMAAVQAPSVTYKLSLPDEVIAEGKLSEVQLEAVVRAGEAHETILPNGQRQGFYDGDGAGAGKGRTAVGIFLDNWNKGRKKHIWVSENQKLFVDATRDMIGAGMGEDKLFKHSATKPNNAINRDEGVMFTTYDTLKKASEGETNAAGEIVKPPRSRIDQIAEWAGEDYDGVIVFDEAHGMKNAVDLISEGRRTNAAGKALAGIALANRLPKARVVYLSATGFTEVSNLAYATRLGLWGEGTAFANVAQFINQVSAGGVAMMEAIAKDLKAMGLYISRALSFEGVEYSHMQHTLTREQLEIHNTAAAAWQRVRAGMEEWIRNTNPDKKGVSAARSSFSTSMQEFFNATITSMQMPSVIEDIQKRLDKGEQAVIQIYRTGKATQDRRLAQAERDGLDVNDINITPADKLIQFLENNFPTTLYENTFDENGNVIRVPVKDSEGNLVDDPDAIAARDELILEVAQLQVPESVLDQLINYTWTVDGEEIHGSDLVAEVTGRDRRVERKDGEAKIAKHGENAGLAQTEEFQKGKRRILVFSEAGGTGRSYHADKDTGNKRRRAHYLLQPGWRADKAVQGLGRSHRTNQYQPPEYILVSTDLMAQRRFLSTIARRLDQLGALTKGSRDTGSQGMFDATMNLESRYGEAAAETLMIDILHGDLNNMDLTGQAITPEVVRDKMGIRLIDEQGGVGSTDVSVRKLLNSMLALEKPLMDRLYEEFVSRVESNIAYAKEQGTFDVGMETVRAQSIVKVDEKTVKSTGRYRGETRYVKLEFTDPTRLMKWKDIQYYAINHAGVPTAPEWHRNRRSGRLYGFVSANNVTDAKTGRMVQRLRRIGVMGVDRIDADQLNNNTYEAVRGSEDQIKALWEQQMEEAPKTQTRTRHLVTGLLLPYFDRLPREDPTIIRLATDEGEVLLGRELPPKKVADTLKKLGISGEAPKLSPAQFFERVLEHGETLMLANGWKVLRRRVSNQNRLELSVQRASSGDYDLLRDMGAFTEVIGHNLRVFIPTADHSVLERVTKAHPVIEIITADGQARRGPVEESSVAVDKIETGLTKQFKTLRQNGFPVEVVETVDNLPVRAYADTKGLYWAGRIFLVAENIGSLKEARRVLAHEAVGHAGLEQMLGKEGFDELVNRVISELDAGNSTLTQAAKAVQKTHGELDNDTLAKEILAHLAENGIQNTFLRRVAARIREWLAKLGLGNLPAAEINSLIARAARFTETSPSRDDRGRFISDTPLFSRDGDPADEGAAFANNRLIQFLKKGQPVDRALRGTFSLGLDITEAEGSKRLKNAFKNAADRLNRREFDDDSSFAWVNPIARYFRAGLVDKYGVDERFIERKEEKKAETRKLNLKAMEFLKNLSEGGVTTRQEWAVIKDVVEGKEIDNERWMKLAAPIRATIDDLGIQAVHLGLLSRESYERLKGVYLHRVYLKHEAQMSGVGNWIAAGMRSRASKIAGNAFKGRGMFDKIEQKRLLRDVDESWWGRRKVDGKADLQLKGAKFIILDDVRQRGEGVDMIEGFDEGGPKPRVVRRVYWPADQAIPDRMADYVNRGTWEIRGTEKGKLILWRDFTKQEREQMGEIVDARYVIAKTFNVLSHDIENAKFFKDIARNKDWTWQDEGLPPSDQIAEPKDPTFWSRTFANAEWVKVPDTTIPKTNGLKAWGDLAGKYVRAEIYRDLQEVRLSMQSNWWKVLMDQWKLLKTARNPVVHMNNVMSNMILMDLLDVRWQDLYQGIKHYRAGDEVYKEAFEAGVFGHSFLDQEIKKQFMDPILDDLIKESLKLGNGSSNTLMDKIRAMDTLARVLYRSGKKIHSADQWAQNLYKAEDEVFRMAAYVRRRELGDTPKQAARVAVRQFLDYDISAPWINNARRTVLPFIAYTYRAAPVIAEAIAARPWKLAKYIILAHIANSLAYMMVPGDEDEERRSLREEEQGWTWMATPRMMRMPYRDRWGNPLFLDIRRWVPAADFFEVREGDAILPTWLHMSGPLAVAFELYLNKDAFTGEEIFDPDLDTTSEALTKLGGHLWRAASTGWAPGGWYWERVGNALRGAEDRSGRQYSLPLALTSSVGIKLKSQDVQAGFESHAFRLDIRLRKLRQELKRAENQYRQNKISKEAFEEQRDRIREKVRRHTEQTRKLIRGK